MVLREFIEHVLQVRGEQANQAACGMEHALGGVVLERLVSFMEYVSRCPNSIAHWDKLKGFQCSQMQGNPSGACEICDSRRIWVC